MGVRQGDRRAVLSLLAIRFEPGEAPAGHITLVLAGGGAIRLAVECIEAELRDLGPSWRTVNKPEHGQANSEAASVKPPGPPKAT